MQEGQGRAALTPSSLKLDILALSLRLHLLFLCLDLTVCIRIFERFPFGLAAFAARSSRPPSPCIFALSASPLSSICYISRL
ncbi:hypothetical protein JB92DRAFT_3161134 [Gautieria morchelliformis]|nr:hypothetical protein JB92DRAFT_3161134 [Gautieria morchelliformis]